MRKIADNTFRRVRYGYNVGSIELYRAAWLDEAVNVFISDWEVAYLTLSTESGFGVLGPINEAEESAAVRRLEVELARIAREFYQVAQQMEFSESAFDLLVLLKKTSALSSQW